MANNSKYKILLVDDDKFLLDIYSVKFHEFGHSVETAFGAEDALRKLEASDDFNGVIMDIVMPSMDGFELLEKMREKGLAKKAAKIVLSNQGEASEVKRANKLGIAGYIVKANTIPSEVLEKVTEILENYSPEA